jgi:hypothetical protein
MSRQSPANLVYRRPLVVKLHGEVDVAGVQAGDQE